MVVEEEEEPTMSQSSTESPAAAARSSQPHGLRPNTERRRITAAAAASASPTPPAIKKVTPNSASAASKTRGGKSPALPQREVEESEGDGWKERLAAIERNFKEMREEKEKMQAEIDGLRDKLEEEVWAKSRLEDKVSDLTERLKEVEKRPEGGGGGGGGGGPEPDTNRDILLREERRKEIKEVEDRLEVRITRVEGRGGGGGGEPVEENQRGNSKQRCIVFTDSNGREATHDSILNHVPREKRGKMEIEVVVAYTLDEAYRRIERGEFRIEGAVVLVDNLTNDVRGTRNRPSVTPQQLLRLVDGVRRKVMAAGAAAVVVCQLKPMQTTDVTPYNEHLGDYLRREKERGRDGYGCRTQIRMDSLKGDGYHVKPEFGSVLDRTYACAFLGIDVPCPTPWGDFAPSHVRSRWESEWPRLVGGGANMTQHGR